MAQTRAQWGSRVGFVLAAAGSAVGLGNIWKFPYITGENGGGLFVIIYLVCIALVGIPIMMAEIMIGRAAQKQPVAAFPELQGRPTAWSGVGWLGVLAGFIILSYYVVVAGWAVDYTLKSVVNFTTPIHERAEAAATEYRATEDLAEMRAAIIEHRAGRAERDEVNRIRAQESPSTWRAWADYQAALESADDRAEAARRLGTDPAIADVVERAEPRQTEIDEAEKRAEAEATEAVEAMSDVAIMDEATDLHRRQVTYKETENTFNAVAGDGWTCIFWSALFMLVTIVIVSRGIAGGIETACRILMPMLFILIGVMVIYGAFKSGFGEALSFVFKPDPSKLKASGVLEALGHAFFTLSLGMGAMITYGSYQKKKDGLAAESVTIAVLDTAIALLACMMIFPIIFSYGQEPSAGPGLVFKSMPLAFAEIGTGGMLLAILFFGLLVFAALTSAISLLEVVASYFIDKRSWPRMRAAWVIGGLIFLFSIPSAFSADPEFAMPGWKASFGQSFFETMDYLASNWMLPAGGLLISIYAGWVMPRRLQQAEVQGLAPAFFTGWLLLTRFVAPALVIVVLLQKVGVLDADEVFHRLF